MKKTTALLFIFSLIYTLSKAQQHSDKPFAIGVIDSLRSELLQETRTLNIYLPQSYAYDTAATYPVIYLLDGSADEDFIHIAGLVQFFNFPWINRFPESIVVGIANTNRKRDFYLPGCQPGFSRTASQPMAVRPPSFPLSRKNCNPMLRNTTG